MTDYLRLLVLTEHGGIYFDTDVEVVHPLDELLQEHAFIGFENDQYVNTGQGIGAESGNEIVLQMLKEYDPLLDGQHGMIGCPKLNTDALVKYGLILNGQTQDLGNMKVYSSEFFNPYDDLTGRLNKTKSTYSIHWYAKSWMSKSTILRSKISKPLHRLLGTDFFRR